MPEMHPIRSPVRRVPESACFLALKKEAASDLPSFRNSLKNRWSRGTPSYPLISQFSSARKSVSRTKGFYGFVQNHTEFATTHLNHESSNQGYLAPFSIVRTVWITLTSREESAEIGQLNRNFEPLILPVAGSLFSRL